MAHKFFLSVYNHFMEIGLFIWGLTKIGSIDINHFSVAMVKISWAIILGAAGWVGKKIMDFLWPYIKRLFLDLIKRVKQFKKPPHGKT